MEARGGGEFFGEDRLRDTVAGALDQEAQAIADAVVSAALDFQHGDARDDIAVVVVKVPSRPTG